jgi:hypothetical protein
METSAADVPFSRRPSQQPVDSASKQIPIKRARAVPMGSGSEANKSQMTTPGKRMNSEPRGSFDYGVSGEQHHG